MKSLFTLGMISTLIAGAGIFVFTAEAQANNPRVHHRVNHRQLRQQGRIGQGMCNGELTKKESARLQMQQQRLAAKEQRMRASGDGLTAKEHYRLEKQQDNLSQNIYQQKHDNQDRH